MSSLTCLLELYKNTHQDIYTEKNNLYFRLSSSPTHLQPQDFLSNRIFSTHLSSTDKTLVRKEEAATMVAGKKKKINC